MRKITRYAGVVAIFAAVALLASTALRAQSPVSPQPVNQQVDTVKTSAGDLRIRPLYHGSVMLEFGGKEIYVDPWSMGNFAGMPPADMIVITHTHLDHLDRSMVDKLHKANTQLAGPPAVIDTLNCAPMCGEANSIGDSEKKTVMGIVIEGVPMYNIVQGSKPGEPYHHKGVGSGYVLNFGDTRVYFSGDTECTAEMRSLKNITVAFLAMNPPRTESPIEAATCANAFKPKIVYPYHYRGAKPEDFGNALTGSGIEVRIRKLEGES